MFMHRKTRPEEPLQRRHTEPAGWYYERLAQRVSGPSCNLALVKTALSIQVANLPNRINPRPGMQRLRAPSRQLPLPKPRQQRLPAQVLDHHVLVDKRHTRHLAKPQPAAVPAGIQCRGGKQGWERVGHSWPRQQVQVQRRPGHPAAFGVQAEMASRKSAAMQSCNASPFPHLTGSRRGVRLMPNSESCRNLQGGGDAKPLETKNLRGSGSRV